MASQMTSQWSRGSDGVLAGVCQGLAKRFSIDIMLVRLAWIFALLFFGFGLGAYFIFAVSLPREDKLAEILQSRIMGVCARFAQRFNLDVGLTRVGFLTLLICTGGLVFFAYIALYFILPSQADFLRNSKSRI